ncbi:SPFH domain-containing protein [Nocardioides gilvus]|uniref:SPFH domain-containing protein n=1 Tax=Nocardioides gilvus TaxID=1735589 RepID=UPI000D748AD2|nr:SPFH domain-containing protein [Nocardioides gilvus]
MFLFIVALVFLLIALAVFVGGGKGKRLVAFVPLLIGVLLLAMSSTTIIQAKNVGVLTTFGKPTRSLTAGLHVKAPWQTVTELDGTKITNKYGDEQRIEVRIGDGTTAGVETAIRWSIVAEKADEIYADYRSDDVNENVREALVETVFKNAVNAVFGQYNPTAELVTVDPNSDKRLNYVPDYDGLAAEVTESMKERVADSGGYVKIEFVTISGISLSPETQKKINEFQAEVARTQVALQAERTNRAQAAANKALSNSVTDNPNVLVSRCLDTLQTMVDKQQPIPAGFTCWPGGGANLVLPGGRN